MKNKILKAITGVVSVAFIVFGCALDSKSWLPAIVCAVCLVWLSLFVVANREVMRKW